MNAQLGKKVNYKFSLHNSTNRNGEYLMDFTLENGLTCLNTKFQKRKGKLWTYIYPNNAKAQIDYILINKKLINSALNYEAYPFFEGVSSDYWIIMAKIHLSLCRNMVQTTTTAQYDWFLLKNRDISDKYTISLRNKFNALQISEILTPNDVYENFVNTHMEVAAECLPTKLRTKHRVPWETFAVKKKNVTMWKPHPYAMGETRLKIDNLG